MDEAEFSIVCNCLFPEELADLDQVGQVVPQAAGTVASAIKRLGNWVGGRVTCTADGIFFAANALNKKFQKGEAEFGLPWPAVRSVASGRMMLMFKTVDLMTDHGPVRFRVWGNSNDRLKAVIEAHIGHDADH